MIDVSQYGITDEQGDALIQLAAAACRSAGIEADPLNYALNNFFDDPGDLVDMGAEVWDRIQGTVEP